MSLISEHHHFIGIFGAAIGFGIAYILFLTLISDRYGPGKPQASKPIYWSGVVSALVVGQTVGAAATAALLPVLTGGQLNVDGLLKPLIAGFVISVTIILIGLMIAKISKATSNDSVQTIAPSGESATTRSQGTAPLVKGNSIGVALIIGVSIVIAAVILKFGGQSSGASSDSLKLSKDFIEVDFEKCESCSTRNSLSCSKFEVMPMSYKGIKVFRDRAHLYLIKDRNNVFFESFPDDPRMTCSVDVDKNFAFSCRKIDESASRTEETQVTFTGSYFMNSNYSSYKKNSGDGVWSTKNVVRCSVRAN